MTAALGACACRRRLGNFYAVERSWRVDGRRHPWHAHLCSGREFSERLALEGNKTKNKVEERTKDKDREICQYLIASTYEPFDRFTSEEISRNMRKFLPDGIKGDGRYCGRSLKRMESLGWLKHENVFGKYGSISSVKYYFPKRLTEEHLNALK